MTRSMLLIANPRAAAGRAQKRWEQLLAGLHAHGLQVDYVMTAYPQHAVALAREAAGRYDALVAVGGDGTVHEVASGILLSAAPQTALGIIPFGTGNDVAQLMGIGGMAPGLQALAGEETCTIDVIEIRCRQGDAPVTHYGLLYAAVGFVGAVLKYTTPRVKRIFGMRYSYSVGVFRALLKYGSPVMRVTSGGETMEGRTFFACAGNAEYTGGGVMRLSPGARLDDGLLNISLIRALGRPAIVRHFPRLLAGTHTELPTVRYFTGTDLSVSADRPVDVAVDGDLIGQTPAEFRLLPHALRILRYPTAPFSAGNALEASATAGH